MHKKKINDYDVTRKMLKTIRTLTESPTSYSTLNEDEVVVNNLPSDEATKNLQDGIEVVNDVDVKILSSERKDLKLTDEQKQTMSGIIDNFKQQVEQITEFDPGFTVSKEQIRLDGKLVDDDISFVFISGKDDGVYINANMLKLEQNVASILEKLAKFQLSYTEAMNPLIDKRKNSI
jgi:hypothetical protein